MRFSPAVSVFRTFLLQSGAYLRGNIGEQLWRCQSHSKEMLPFDPQEVLLRAVPLDLELCPCVLLLLPSPFPLLLGTHPDRTD